VSAWTVENEIVLRQRKVDEKSNEITVIPELLKLLAISGCIVTIDAIGTQTNVSRYLLEQYNYKSCVENTLDNLIIFP
jgi:predicted transposase YbfD/YdcC